MLMFLATCLAATPGPLPEPVPSHLPHGELGALVHATSPGIGMYGGWDGRLRAMTQVELWSGPSAATRGAIGVIAGRPPRGNYLELRSLSEVGVEVVPGARVSALGRIDTSPGMRRVFGTVDAAPGWTGSLHTGARVAAGPQLGQLQLRGALEALWPVALLGADPAHEFSVAEARSIYRGVVDLDVDLGDWVLGAELGITQSTRSPSTPVDFGRPRPSGHARLRAGVKL